VQCKVPSLGTFEYLLLMPAMRREAIVSVMFKQPTLTLRIIGLLLFLVGATFMILLFSPWKDWALNHSVASFVSATDRRAGNSIDGPVDMPISIAGNAVLMFTGLWTGILMPRVLTKFKAQSSLQGSADGQRLGE
jgi:uncharacterized protein YjeT (DUF2065 family)